VDRALLAAAVFGAAFVSALVLVPFARSWGKRFGVMDHPGERKVHESSTPRSGGWAVLSAFMATVGIGYLSLPLLQGSPVLRSLFGSGLDLLREAHRVEVKLAAVLAGATLAFAVGLADDLLGRRFPVWLKAAGQLLAAAIVVGAGVRTSVFPFEWLNVVVTMVWLVGITNAFNLLDNMDGLSAGVALVASSVLLVNAWSLQEYFISLLLLAFVGTLAGFLVFNFSPASVFLGDCGSHFIGFSIASLTLLERYVSHASSTYFPVLMPVLVLAVPIMDTATVVVIRLREGRPVYVGDSCHLSHQLVRRGFSQRAAVLILYLTTLTLGLGAISLTDASLWQSAFVLLQSLGFVAVTLMLIFGRVRSVPRAGEP
jgi:UDP-GlcNAc:undecaprenyl-phosphate GlcNAc-1-phosphate transferase